MKNEEQLFMAIHNCDDQYINEALDEMSASHPKTRRSFSVARAAAASIACILIIGTGITALAAVSDSFHAWLLATFSGFEENYLLSLSDNLLLYRGDRESFVCETRTEDEKLTVTKVYRIAGNKLKQLKTSRFTGSYDGEIFSFEYATIAGEILGFNRTGCCDCVFPVLDGNCAYLCLAQTDEDIITKACIAKANLKTGSLEKISGDDMRCNFLPVPGGGRILCNHRAEGYWTVFELATGEELVLEGISGYARNKEISFIDRDHIFTLTDEVCETTENGETYLTPVSCLIDLRTGKVTQKFELDVGELSPEWCYRSLEDRVEIYNIATGDSFALDDIDPKSFYGVSSIGSYVLLWKYDRDMGGRYLYHIRNTGSGRGMDLEIPDELRSSVQIYLAASEQKLIISNGSEACLVDISRLGKTR